MATLGENKGLARRFVEEVINAGKFELYDHLLDRSFTSWVPGGQTLSFESRKQAEKTASSLIERGLVDEARVVPLGTTTASKQ